MSNQTPFNNSKFDNFYDRVDNFVRGSFNSARNFISDNFRADIKEADTEYIVEAELPGVSKDEISVSIDRGKLVIKVTREVDEEAEKAYVHKERRRGSMIRELYLENADDELTTAKMDKGILTITVSKIVKVDTSKKVDID